MRRDREKIKRLIRIIDDVRNYLCPFMHCCPANSVGDATWRQIQDLLEKQIPKKPKDYPFSDGQCPSCDAVFEFDWGTEPKFCGNCGQKLSWSNET